MNDQPARKSHVWVWILSVVAVPVLYVLSIGPAVYYDTIQSFEKGPYRAGWQEVYWAPILWLNQNDALHGMLGPYFDWWYRLAESHYRASHPSAKPAP